MQHLKMCTLYTVLQYYRLQWMGHVLWMEDFGISKSILFGQLKDRSHPQIEG